MRRLLDDLRLAIHQLAKAPGFTVAIVLILALGIGPATAVLSVVDNILFRPLHFPDADRLVTLCEVHLEDRAYCTASPPNVADWQAGTRALSVVGVARERSIQIRREAGKLDVPGAMATPGYLDALGIRPLQGRLLREEDMLPRGTGRVVVLSYELWQSEFGGDPDIIGRTLTVSSGGDGQVLADDPVMVVGILPEGVQVPRQPRARAWIPLQLDPRAQQIRGWRGFVTVARLAPDVTLAVAAQELNRVQSSLADAYPDDLRNWTVEVQSMRAYLVSGIRPLLLLFLGAVAAVLLIVCVNVMGLLLARATRRQHELTVRAALGAQRTDLLRQLLVEALVLALLGGAAGVLLASWLVDAFVALAPPGIPRLADVTIDSRILALGLVLTAITALLAGLVPALRAGGMRLHDSLRAVRTTAGRRGTRLRQALVVAQLALTLALVLSAGLLLRSFGRLVAFDPGFELDHLLTFQVFPPQDRYPTREQLVSYYARAEAALEAIPGVTSAGTTSAGPLTGGGDGRTPFLIAGRPAVAVQDAPTVEWYNAGPGYFPTLGVSIIQGRNLSPDDRIGATPTALITRSMAERYWPGASPIGARLSLPNWDTEAEVVGVVPDLPRGPEEEPVQPSIFVSDRQRPRGASFYLVRTSVEPASVIPAVRRTLTQLDPDVEPRALATMAESLGARLVAPRFNLALIASFALIALLLSAAGIYAVIAYTVALRTREFGIRMALGAAQGRVLRSVLLEGGRLLAAGLILGGLGAFYFTRLLRGLLHDVAPGDLAAIIGTLLMLAFSAGAATLVPALRASRTEPASVLRSE